MAAVQAQSEPVINVPENATEQSDLDEAATRRSYGEGGVIVLQELSRMHPSALTCEVVREVGTQTDEQTR